MRNYDGLDKPGTDPAKDAFNRWPFCKRLSEMIAELNAADGAPVIGIFGKWGDGKSTALNYIKGHLEANYKQRVVVCAFNPWFFRNQEALVSEFFEMLSTELASSTGLSRKEFGEALKKVSGLFGFVDPSGGIVSNLIDEVGQRFSSELLEDRRDEVSKNIRKANRTVVVLIDDLDQLDHDEIVTMLKLVRLNANFPRIVYLLAFDDNIVAKAIGPRYGDGDEDGHQFLQKIIQYPFALPPVGRGRLTEFVLAQARESCAGAGVDLTKDEWVQFREIIDLDLSSRLDTPRQAIRYANALRFTLPMLAGMANPFDQLLVESLNFISSGVQGNSGQHSFGGKIGE